eukprot:gene2897-3484_t
MPYFQCACVWAAIPSPDPYLVRHSPRLANPPRPPRFWWPTLPTGCLRMLCSPWLQRSSATSSMMLPGIIAPASSPAPAPLASAPVSALARGLQDGGTLVVDGHVNVRSSLSQDQAREKATREMKTAVAELTS